MQSPQQEFYNFYDNVIDSFDTSGINGEYRELLWKEFEENFSILRGLETVIHEHGLSYDKINEFLQGLVVVEDIVPSGNIHWTRYAHNRNVSDTLEQIAVSEQKDAKTVEEWKVAGLLHDLGKYILNEDKDISILKGLVLKEHRLRHVLLGEIAVNYLSLRNYSEFVFNSIVFHHDANPHTFLDNYAPVHIKGFTNKIRLMTKKIAFADSFSAQIEWWRKYTDGHKFPRQTYEFLKKDSPEIELPISFLKNMTLRINSRIRKTWVQLQDSNNLYQESSMPYSEKKEVFLNELFAEL